MIRLFLADSHAECRSSLFANLSCQEDFEVIGLGKDGYEAIRLAENLKPDIALLEMELPPVGGIKTANILKRKFPAMSVILLSALEKDRGVLNSFSSYIAGYVSKTAGRELLFVAIRAVYHGGRLITPELADHFDVMMSQSRSSQTSGSPTKKDSVPVIMSRTEMVIMSHISRGLTNREIAEQLSLREGTIRNYISSALQKTGLHDRTQLEIYTLQHDLAC
jgi:DNA-binding NarL/FixJ family response regulator